MKNDTLGVIAALTIIVVSGALVSYRKTTHEAPIETMGLLMLLVVIVIIAAMGIRPVYNVILRI